MAAAKALTQAQAVTKMAVASGFSKA